jgi:DNA polymerase-3 subunit gamma/tau
MSYLVVARKWRPQSFEEVAGQSHITRTLQNAIRADRIAHAYLFTGVRGVGKTSAARILAKALNCEKGPTATPCNQCSHCNEITSGKAIDVFEIDAASNRGIDEVRQIIENVRYQPAKCRFKVYIIDEVHQVTKEAFNALLKTLEEPPPSVKFILATTEPHRLPETILSRCQRYDFRRIALREIVERLSEIARNEGLSITEGALVLLAREADGSMRDAQSLLEQVLASADSGSRVDEQTLQESLGLAERRALYDLSSSVIAGNAGRCLELIAAIALEGRDLSRLSRDLVEQFRNLLVARLMEQNAGGNSGGLLDLPDQEIADLMAQSRDLSVETLMDYFDFISAGDDEVARSANPRFALEVALVKLATLPKTLPVSELLERLERLERKLAGRPIVPAATTKEPPTPLGTAEQRAKIPSAVVPAEPAANSTSGQTAPTRQMLSSDKEEMWRQFVSAVRSEEKFLASHLDNAKVLDLVPGRLSIGVGKRLELSSLQDTEKLASLKSIANRFFAEDVAIEVKLIPESTGEKDKPTDSNADSAAAAKLTDLTNETLRVFPGSSVRSVRREGGEA